MVLVTRFFSFNELLIQEADETADGEDEAASLLLLNPVKNGDNQSNNNWPTSVGIVEDEYLNLDDYNSCHNTQFSDQYNNQQQNYGFPHKSYGGDSVVPIQCCKRKDQVKEHCFQLRLEYKSSNTEYNYPGSMSPNVGVVPESTMSESSITYPRLPKGTIDLFSGLPIQTLTQLKCNG